MEDTKKDKPTNSLAIYAIIQHATTLEVQSISAKRKKELSKALGDMLDWNVVGVFKGRLMTVQQRKSFDFN